VVYIPAVDMVIDPATTRVHPFVPPAPPRTPKGADTRQRLLDVATGLFIERGYSVVSMRDVAAAARLTKGAVYGHFRSKGQLLVEVIRTRIAEGDHAPGFHEAVSDRVTGVALMYASGRRDIRVLEVDAAAAARHDPDVAAGLAELYEDRHTRIRDAMADMRDPDAAAWIVGVASGGIGMKEAAGLPRPDDERLRDVLLDLLKGMSR
jgi:AcrR family transcriptional regulator